MDIENTVDEVGFFNIVSYKNDDLILTTRNCSLLVYNIPSKEFTAVLKNAHSDYIPAIIVTDRKIVTGSRSKDGSIAVWVNMLNN